MLVSLIKIGSAAREAFVYASGFVSSIMQFAGRRADPAYRRG
jgi:hypothetical protein